MAWGLDPIYLNFQSVSVKTLDSGEVPAVAAAICDPEGWYARKLDIKTQTDCELLLKNSLKSYSRGTVHPLYYSINSEVAGITRLKKLDPGDRCLEIGGTWVAKKWQRSHVNTEVKLALLDYCFDQLSCMRVEFRIDEENTVSRVSIEQLGAVLEGCMRDRIIRPDGSTRNCLLFSIVSKEWPLVRARLMKRYESYKQRSVQRTSP